MTEIYLIRHCEAEGNLLRVFQGLTEYDISKTGARQLECLGERFKTVHIDKIYSSPLTRAYKTAKAVADIKNMEIIPWDGLREMNLGDYEGRKYDEIFSADPNALDAWKNHPQNFVPPNGEKMRDAYERIWNELLKIVKQNKGKTVAAATHGGVLRCLICRLMYGDIERLNDTPWSANTAVALVRFDESLKPELVFSNDASHLPADLIPPTSNPSNISKKE